MTEFAVGDLIKAYRDGIHRVVMIEKRYYSETDKSVLKGQAVVGQEYTPIIYYTPVLTGTELRIPVSKIVHSCPANLCTKMTKELLLEEKNKRLSEIETRFERVFDLIPEEVTA